MRITVFAMVASALLASCQAEEVSLEADRTAGNSAEPRTETAAPTDLAQTDRATAQTVSISTQDTPAMLHQLEFTSITGEPMPFSTYAGKVVLVVNTASRCGFTGQYAGLQALWSEYKDKGLVVLGVPSNDFGGQEPGTEEQVKSFCEINYGVDFPLTSKTAVVGSGRHPFYAGLEDALGESARPKWNFHKVLVGKDGTPLEAFPSSVAPDAPELMAAIDGALAG